MGVIASLLAKLLSPISFGIAFAVVLFSRKKSIIVVAAVVAAVVSETILSLAQSTRIWGQGLPIGIVASAAQASLIFYIRDRRSRKKDGA